jgi:hypothetical protein
MVLALGVVVAVITGAFVVPKVPSDATGGGSFFTRCDLVRLRQVDPLVQPGMNPSMHMHAFYGAADVTSTTTNADLATMSTTCSTPADRSAYWAPTLVDSAGTYVPAPNVNAYYIVGGYQPATIPDNTMLVGTQAKYTCGTGKWADLSAGAAPFACTGLGPAVNGNQGVMPRIVVYFPSCLHADGSIGYAGGCVARIPQVQLDLRFPDRTSLDGLQPSSGAWSAMHADYMFGWDAARFSGLLDRCLNAHIICTSTVTG